MISFKVKDCEHQRDLNGYIPKPRRNLHFHEGKDRVNTKKRIILSDQDAIQP